MEQPAPKRKRYTAKQRREMVKKLFESGDDATEMISDITGKFQSGLHLELYDDRAHFVGIVTEKYSKELHELIRAMMNKFTALYKAGEKSKSKYASFEQAWFVHMMNILRILTLQLPQLRKKSSWHSYGVKYMQQEKEKDAASTFLAKEFYCQHLPVMFMTAWLKASSLSRDRNHLMPRQATIVKAALWMRMM